MSKLGMVGDKISNFIESKEVTIFMFAFCYMGSATLFYSFIRFDDRKAWHFIMAAVYAFLGGVYFRQYKRKFKKTSPVKTKRTWR